MLKIEKTVNFFKKYFGDHLPLKVRFFNIVFFGGIFTGILSTITCIVLHTSTTATTICAVWTLLMPLIFIFANCFSKYYNGIVVISLILLNFIFFPVIFLTGGGIDSGIPSFFVLGIVFTMLLIEGRLGIILSVVEGLFYLGVYAFAYFCHDYVAEISGAKFTYEAISSNVALVALTIGLISKSIFKSYKKEKSVVSGLLAKLEDLSVKDPLTSTYNRRYMTEFLENSIEEACKYKSSLSVFMIDIDKFKDLNDTYGHLVGDEVLVNLCSLLKSMCRENDVVSRFGGEEFLIIFTNTDIEVVKKRAEEIRSAVEHSKLSESLKNKVTISGGIGLYEEGMNCEKLISAADENLYKAKNNGRNRIYFNDLPIWEVENK